MIIGLYFVTRLFYGKYLDDLTLPMYTKSKEKSEKYIHLLRKHSKRDKKNS